MLQFGKLLVSVLQAVASRPTAVSPARRALRLARSDWTSRRQLAMHRAAGLAFAIGQAESPVADHYLWRRGRGADARHAMATHPQPADPQVFGQGRLLALPIRQEAHSVSSVWFEHQPTVQPEGRSRSEPLSQ